jgi:ubiquinone/menaquinone biosynthesis C-methylase UbiE
MIPGIMNFYKLISGSYDELYGEEQRAKSIVIKENLKISRNDLLLDVGCGTGLSSDFGCKVVGIDPCFEMLEKNVNIKILATGESMPFKDKIFDKVVSVTSLHNFDDIAQGVNEIKRVGKKDFVFSIMKSSAKFETIEKLLSESFKIKKIADGKKDWIFFCVFK